MRGTFETMDDNDPTFYPTFDTVVARDKPPEGDRYALATWSQDMSDWTHYYWYPVQNGANANNGPIATPQDNMLLGRSLVNPSY